MRALFGAVRHSEPVCHWSGKAWDDLTESSFAGFQEAKDLTDAAGHSRSSVFLHSRFSMANSTRAIRGI